MEDSMITCERLIDESLSENKLIQIAKTDNLATVTYLELKVDSRQTGFGNIGKFVPSLEHLKLNNSHVASIRDLGAGLKNLTILWMARCHLSDLEGLGSLSALRELYVAFNHIKEIETVGLLENLEILDLEGNDVSDANQIEHLALCSSLRTLTLEGNPIEYISTTASKKNPSNEPTMIIYDVLPQLTVLDDTPIRLPERMSIPERSQSSRGYYHDVPIDVSPVPSRLVKEFPPTVPETCEDVVPPSIRSPTPPRPPTQFTKNEPHNASPQISSKAVVDTQRPKTSFELHLKSLKTPRPPSSLPPPLNFRGGFPTILPKPPLIPPINSQKSPAIGKRQFVVCKVTDAALEEPRNWTPTPPSGPPRIPNSNSNSSPSRIQRIHTRTIIAAEERLIDLN